MSESSLTWALLLCISVGQLQLCMTGKRCDWNDTSVLSALFHSSIVENVHNVLRKLAVFQCWVIVNLHEGQTCTGVFVVTPGCCLRVLLCSTQAFWLGAAVFAVLGVGLTVFFWCWLEYSVRYNTHNTILYKLM